MLGQGRHGPAEQITPSWPGPAAAPRNSGGVSPAQTSGSGYGYGPAQTSDYGPGVVTGSFHGFAPPVSPAPHPPQAPRHPQPSACPIPRPPQAPRHPQTPVSATAPVSAQPGTGRAPSNGAAAAGLNGFGRSATPAPPTVTTPPRPINRPKVPDPIEVPPEDLDTDEAEVESDGTYRGAAIAALIWCTLPLALFIGWAILLSGGSRSGCIDNSGQPCAAPHVVAWQDLPYAAPVVAVAVLLSVMVALLLRRITTGWRSGTVGFASAVVGAGVVTVFWTAFWQG